MTIGDINSYVSFRASTDTTNYTAANRLISTNRWYHKIVTMILDSQDEWEWDDSNRTDFPIATTDLVAGQQDYGFPGSLKILKIKRVEININGTWQEAKPIDNGEITSGTDSTSIANQFSTSEPRYDMTASSILLYPIPTANVTGGLKIWFSREPAEFTSGEVTTGTKEPGFDEPFHIMIAFGMIYDWCSAKAGTTAVLATLKQDIEKELFDYEVRLRKYYGSKQKDRDYALGAEYVSYE